MAERIPETIRDVETRYWVISAEKLALLARMIGGVMMPASMASECWKPRSRARNTGTLSLRPKKGADWEDFFMKGILGVKRKA